MTAHGRKATVALSLKQTRRRQVSGQAAIPVIANFKKRKEQPLVFAPRKDKGYQRPLFFESGRSGVCIREVVTFRQ